MKTLVVVTDGRMDYLAQTMGSAADHLDLGWFDRLVMVDDSGDREYRAWLARSWPEFDLVSHDQRMGLAAAVADGWEKAKGSTFVFHLEEDFTFTRPVDLDGMAEALAADPFLAQVCLKRQAWSPPEIHAGGIVEADPGGYAPMVLSGHSLTLHYRCFSLNPCLIPGTVVDMGWPVGNEADMTRWLVKNGYSFAYWGAPYDPPAVTHIGSEGGMGSPGWKP